MTRKSQSTILTVLCLMLATANAVPLFGQGVPFNVTIPGAGTTDFKTVVNFQTPVGSGAGRVTLIKFVTDATPANIQFRLEPQTAGTNGPRLPVTFNTAGVGSLTEGDGVTDVATAIIAQSLPDAVAAGHSLMLVTIQYADSYNFTAAEPWRLTIAEQPASRAYFGFSGSNQTDVTRGKLQVLNPSQTIEFGDLFEGIATNFAPILPVDVRNVGTANIAITGVPITNNSPVFFTTVQAAVTNFVLPPGKKLTTVFADPLPNDGLWVRARPSALGAKSATLTLQTDLAGENPTVTLNTRGVSLYSHFVFDISGSMGYSPQGVQNVPEKDSRLWKAKQAALKVNDWIQSFTDGQAYTGLSTFPASRQGNLVIDQGRSSTNHLPINFHMGEQADGGLPADGGTPMQQGLVAGRSSMVNRLPALGLSGADRPNLFQAMLLLSDGAENGGSNARAEINSLKDNQIKIYAAAYGLAGEADIPLLKALSVGDGANPGGTGGAFYEVDVDKDFALKEAFKLSAAAFLGLDPIVDPEGAIRRGQTRNHTVCVGSDAFGVTFSIDWNRNVAGAINFTLRDPNGATITPASPNISFFQGDTHATYVIRGARMIGGQGAGRWTLQLTGGNGIPNNEDTRYSYSALAQSPQKAKPKLRPELYTTDFHLFELATDSIQTQFLAQPTIQVHYDAPSQSLGTFLATNSVKPEWVFNMRNPTGPDVTTPLVNSAQIIPITLPSEPGQPSSIAARKAAALAKFANKPFPNERKTQTLQLFDDGTHGDKVARDGIYSSDAPELRVAGSHKYIFDITTPLITTLGCFDRQISVFRYIDVKLLPEVMIKNISWLEINKNTFFDPSVAAAMGGSPRQGFTRRAVAFTPQDTIGNMWGPGRANEIKFTVGGATLVGNVIDNWDGSYIQVVDFPTGTSPSATVTAAGVTSGSVSAPTQPSTSNLGRFSLGLRGGVAIPHGAARNVFDAGGAFTADLEYHATNQLSAVGLFGYRRFSAGFPFVSGFNVFQFSGGAKAYLTGSGPLRPFVNGGIGAFKFDPGSTRFGVYGGGGLQYQAWQRVWLEGEYNYQSVFTSGSNFKFSTVQGGVRFRF